ncbi:MAG TPA: DUF362 domain-containing protein [Phycisphaerae bacterium]|nr:DUF362 domain-containing protein [Phycisphaerae bacterium]
MADKQNKQAPSVAGDRSRVWTRRDVIVRGGQTVVAAGLATGAAWWLYDPRGDAGLQQPEPIRLKDYFSAVEFSPAAPRISAAYGPPESIDQFEQMLRMARAAVGGLDADRGMARFIRKGDVVMLKPNVGFDRGPQLAATTNPQVVRAVIRLCREAGARKVIVADNPIENPPACFAKSGIQSAAEAEGATVVIHSDSHDAPVQVRAGSPDPSRGEALGTWPIFWTPLREADKVIGIPPIKDHNLCYASMGMKNWYGLLSGRRNQFHQAIHDIVSDLGFMMKPTLMVIDGTRVMMRNGPTGGRLDDVQIGGVGGRPVVVASVDQLACDSWCLQNLLGRDPAAVSYLSLAYQKFGQDPTRLVAPSWQDYKLQGKIVETTI